MGKLTINSCLVYLCSMYVCFFQNLNDRAQGEVTIREALNELDLWGAKSRFALTEHQDSTGSTLVLIKEWKDLLNKVRILFTLFYHKTYSTLLNNSNNWLMSYFIEAFHVLIYCFFKSLKGHTLFLTSGWRKSVFAAVSQRHCFLRAL